MVYVVSRNCWYMYNFCIIWLCIYFKLCFSIIKLKLFLKNFDKLCYIYLIVCIFWKFKYNVLLKLMILLLFLLVLWIMVFVLVFGILDFIECNMVFSFFFCNGVVII